MSIGTSIGIGLIGLSLAASLSGFWGHSPAAYIEGWLSGVGAMFLISPPAWAQK